MIFQALILMINKQISMATNILLFQYLKVRNEMNMFHLCLQENDSSAEVV